MSVARRLCALTLVRMPVATRPLLSHHVHVDLRQRVYVLDDLAKFT